MTQEKGRRRRSDSAEGRAATLAAALAGDIPPPAHVKLLKRDLPFWRAITRARAREVWTEVDLVHAANLARCQADIERLQREIRRMGDVLKNDRGTPVANPRHVLLETLSRRAIALSRMLTITPRSASPNAWRDDAAKKRAEDEARQALEVGGPGQADDDDLIPRAALLQ